MHKALKRFTTILLSSFFLIVFINFAVIAQDTQNNRSNTCIWRFVFCGIIFVISSAMLVCNIDALRSPGIKGVYYNAKNNKIEEINDKPKKNENPFSLSLTQLAFWTVLILGAYLWLYAVTGKYTGTFSYSATILLGINSGTAVVASIIDGQNGEEGRKGTRRTSKNFVKDILYDFNGINFHRLQAAMWTIVIGFVFIFQVIKENRMPEFDESLLALQGVSAGSYLGLRSTENQKDKEIAKDEPNKKEINNSTTT
ncbi:MAG: hypothetical protein AN483_07970 [Aphanizomenon flos-aquae MDT14a]|jgi:hypothetical protein|nr:MAG: hypothetical protein AN483_07970 [Aphanizomenon flos-aquae MDT14a]